MACPAPTIRERVHRRQLLRVMIFWDEVLIPAGMATLALESCRPPSRCPLRFVTTGMLPRTTAGAPTVA